MLSLIQGNPEAIYNQLYQNNPKFKQFIDENKDKSLEQIALEYNIPLK